VVLLTRIHQDPENVVILEKVLVVVLIWQLDTGNELDNTTVRLLLLMFFSLSLSPLVWLFCWSLGEKMFFAMFNRQILCKVSTKVELSFFHLKEKVLHICSRV
jgi:hypothetical protein